MSNQYLVTGVAGFIGSQVADRLIAAGHDVVGIDNVNDYYDIRLKEHRLKLLEAPNFKLVRGDIEDVGLLTTLFDQHEFSVVLNLAARAGVRYSIQNPHVYMTTNAMGSLNLMDQMRRTRRP